VITLRFIACSIYRIAVSPMIITTLTRPRFYRQEQGGDLHRCTPPSRVTLYSTRLDGAAGFNGDVRLRKYDAPHVCVFCRRNTCLKEGTINSCNLRSDFRKRESRRIHGASLAKDDDWGENGVENGSRLKVYITLDIIYIVIVFVG